MDRSSRFASLAFALLAGCGSTPPPSPKESLSLNQEGAESFRRGDLAGAREAYGKAILASPKDSESFALNALSFARVEQAAGNGEAAHRALDQVLASGAAPGLRAEAAGRKALLYLGAADLKQAGEWQGRAQALCDRCRAQAAILNIGARIALAGGQAAAATQLAERVLKLPASDDTRAEQANARRILAEAEATASAAPPSSVSRSASQPLAQPALGAPREEVR